ncbi:MAG: hypothetical protein WD317_01880 [Balneolaceae bacterium]
MSKMWILGVTLIVMLASIFLISSGTIDDDPRLWWTGLIMLGAGGLVPPFTRYLYNEEEKEDPKEENASSPDSPS